MDEEQVQVCCRFCGALVATFDDIVDILQKRIMFFKKVRNCNVELTDEGSYRLYRTPMPSRNCKCKWHIGMAPTEVSGGGAISNSDIDVYALLLDKVVLMRGDGDIEKMNSEATALMEECCHRIKLGLALAAKEKGKSPAAVDEVERGPSTDDIGSQYRTALKRLRSIIRIIYSLETGGLSLEVAKLRGPIDEQIPQLQSELREIRLTLAKLQSGAATETEESSEKVTPKMEDIERRIGMITSVIARFEEDLAAGFLKMHLKSVK